MFTSMRNTFEKFFAIRDQEVKPTTRSSVDKSPLQIKREHMQTTIPMFSENITKYRWVKRTLRDSDS